MGKKSRRSNWNKPKDIPAAASTAVAAPVATLKQLYESQDWEGALELESKMSGIAKEFENNDPGRAGVINFMLGDAHKQMGREGGIKEASL